jgi:hypothetical protein
MLVPMGGCNLLQQCYVAASFLFAARVTVAFLAGCDFVIDHCRRYGVLGLARCTTAYICRSHRTAVWLVPEHMATVGSMVSALGCELNGSMQHPVLSCKQARHYAIPRPDELRES